MVELQSDNNIHQLILSPNRSMSWQTNKKILLGIFVTNTIIAASWAYMGAWMVLPFAGLEVLLVGLGMYYVSWKLSFKEVIRLESESIIVQKGVHFPRQQWHWQKSETSLIKQASKYRMSAPNLFLKHLNDRIEIGRFLNRTEKLALRDALQKLGIPIISIPAQ